MPSHYGHKSSSKKKPATKKRGTKKPKTRGKGK